MPIFGGPGYWEVGPCGTSPMSTLCSDVMPQVSCTLWLYISSNLPKALMRLVGLVMIAESATWKKEAPSEHALSRLRVLRGLKKKEKARRVLYLYEGSSVVA
jgi:hypothetical protein